MNKHEHDRLILLAALLAAIALGILWASRPVKGEAATANLSILSTRLAVGAVAPGGQFTGTPADVTYQGTIAYADPKYGPLYLALPEPRGTVARICGPAGCVTRTSTDYGPDQRVHPDRIADVSSTDFVTICGVPLEFGLCPGSVTIERRPSVTLPPTDAE
jgi:hypothetical protein